MIMVTDHHRSVCVNVSLKDSTFLLSAVFAFFADTLKLFYNDPNGTSVPIPLTSTGIAWWTDKHVKFRNPVGTNSNLTAVFQGIASQLRLLHSLSLRERLSVFLITDKS